MPITLNVNGSQHSVEPAAGQNLLSVLRDELELTGTKYGCGEGQCGACTVLVDGKPVRSCRTPADSAVGKQITTIEGLEQNGQLHPVQHAFMQAEAFQCGYCTPGMILGAVYLLNSNSVLHEGDIVRYMNGHVCRCGTYPRIVAAIRAADAVRRQR